jgi:hypothetical protein
MIITSLRGRVVLYPDAIEIRSGLPFWNRRLERKDIAVKVTRWAYVPIHILVPRDKAQKKLTVGMMGSEDDYYREWVAGIPDAEGGSLRSRHAGRR